MPQDAIGPAGMPGPTNVNPVGCNQSVSAVQLELTSLMSAFLSAA